MPMRLFGFLWLGCALPGSALAGEVACSEGKGSGACVPIGDGFEEDVEAATMRASLLQIKKNKTSEQYCEEGGRFAHCWDDECANQMFQRRRRAGNLGQCRRRTGTSSTGAKCCDDHMYYPTGQNPTPAPPEEDTWSSYGAGTVCRLEGDTSPDGWGSALVLAADTVDDCKDLCKLHDPCFGIEFSKYGGPLGGGRCEVWTKLIDHVDPNSPYECIAFNGKGKTARQIRLKNNNQGKFCLTAQPGADDKSLLSVEACKSGKPEQLWAYGKFLDGHRLMSAVSGMCLKRGVLGAALSQCSWTSSFDELDMKFGNDGYHHIRAVQGNVCLRGEAAGNLAWDDCGADYDGWSKWKFM